MNKLVSRNPVQRFKLGQKIEKLQDGGWAGYYTVGNWPKSGNYSSKVAKKQPIKEITIEGRQLPGVTVVGKRPTQSTTIDGGQLPEVVVIGQRKAPVKKSSSKVANINPISFKKAFNNARNAGQETFNWRGQTYNTRNKGEENYVFQNRKWVNPNTVIENSRQSLVNRINSTPTTDELVSKQPTNVSNTSEVKEIPMPQIVNSNNFNQTYNRNNIRANRNIYSNVDQYYNYITNQDSNESKLWNNILGGLNNDDRRKAFDMIMSKYGISGNLGRRDSERLANLQNDLNLIGIPGSDARKAYLREYWNEYKNPFLNYLSTYKTGGQLVSRNPIQRFKSNFRKETP